MTFPTRPVDGDTHQEGVKNYVYKSGSWKLVPDRKRLEKIDSLGSVSELNAGTGPGDVVVLDEEGRLPEVDASQLKNLTFPAFTLGKEVEIRRDMWHQRQDRFVVEIEHDSNPFAVFCQKSVHEGYVPVHPSVFIKDDVVKISVPSLGNAFIGRAVILG